VSGKLRPALFPRVFGPGGDGALDERAARTALEHVAAGMRAAGVEPPSPEQLADDFLHVACETMARAIKRISTQRGHDVTDHVLCCFGGAAGQHACLVADALGMTQVLLHPLAGVLSAYGMGLADVRALRERSLEAPLEDAEEAATAALLAELEAAALADRPDFVAQRAELEAAAARLRLERAAAVPNLVVGVARGREADREDLDTLRAGIAIPLFQRNQGAIAVARAEAEAERARLFGTELTVRREVAAAAARAEATARALGLLQHAVAGSLGENLDLVRKGLAAGKLRASEVLVMRQELVASHRDLIAAAADAWRAQIALALALGNATPPLPDPATPTLEAVR